MLGANVGAFALPAACRVGQHGRVVALEPSASLFQCLRANAAMNGLSNVSTIEAAIDAVDRLRLDQLLIDANIRHVDVMRIDAVGLEAKVVESAMTLIGRPEPPVFVFESIGHDHAQQFLMEQGYTLWQLSGIPSAPPAPHGARDGRRHDDYREAGVKLSPARRVSRTRQGGTVRLLDSIRRDVIAGARLLVRTPGFSATAIATLAVAIGANTAVFAVVNALLFKPTPVARPHELGRVDTGPSLTSWLNYEDIRSRNDAFVDVLASRRATTTLSTSGVPEELNGQFTSVNFFSLLGVPAALGRTYTAADTRSDLVVLSNHVWRVRFGSVPTILGQRLTIGGRPFEVIGVMPRTFRGLAPPGLHPDFWSPVDTVTPSRSLTDRALFEFDVVGRLKPSTTHEQATAALRVLTTRMRIEHPDLPDSFPQALVVPVEGVEAFRGMSGILMPVFAFLALMAVVSGFVLLIGCANIAGLLVSRATTRQREVAVRLALGAGRRRLIRQLLTESLVLAIVGGSAGLLLTMWLVGAANSAVAFLPVPIEFDLRIDGRVLAYAIGLSTLACVFFGLAPAWSATRLDLVSSLKDEGGSTARQRMRRALLVGQVAMCTALLVWSGLFVNSLRHISAVDPGFDASGVVIASVELERSTTHGRGGRTDLRRVGQACWGLADRGDLGTGPRRPARPDRPRGLPGFAAERRHPLLGRRQSAHSGVVRNGSRSISGRPRLHVGRP